MTLLNELKQTIEKTRLFDHTWKVRKECITDSFPLGRVPNVGLMSNRNNCKKVNRYLEYQNTRLRKHLKAGNFDAVAIIFLILLKNSKSYQIALIHRCKTNWY